MIERIGAPMGRRALYMSMSLNGFVAGHPGSDANSVLARPAYTENNETLKEES
jgi:hypothetical protein